MSEQIVKPLALAAGVFYVTEFSATGGVKYARIGDAEVIADHDALTAKYATRKDVDHVGLLAWSKKIINAAYGVTEKHATPTPIGYWIEKGAAPAMVADLTEIQEQARNLNKHAIESGSARRCRIDLWALEISGESLESVAIRLAETVRERLIRLIADLRAGDLNAYSTSWRAAKNLPRLASGIQAESIVLALGAAREARRELSAALKTQAPEQAGASLDLGTIESAVFLFTDSVNGNLAEIEDPDA